MQNVFLLKIIKEKIYFWLGSRSVLFEQTMDTKGCKQSYIMVDNNVVEFL